MSLPLKDFRLGIPESVDIFLEAEAAAFGKDKAAIAREILKEWAKKKEHARKVATKLLAANGLQPEFDWETQGEDGVSRSGGRR